MLSYFNSIKVQLEQVCLNVLSTLSALFQFHKGTIRTCIPSRTLYVKLYFNSIKVQLEPSSQHRRSANPSFQFHKGTIRTYCTQSLSVLITLFQFHKGTIRTDRFCSDRLRSSGFQFHKGTIRTNFMFLMQH